MKKFLDEDFLLETKTGQSLYDDFAREMPIIDYHCHLPAEEIAKDIRFENITQLWLKGDHYKWRAMRANGIDEAYITGNKSDLEKFQKWAETVPFTIRNPLYHWTHLELKRYFGIEDLLTSDNAKNIFAECNEKLKSPEFSVRNLLRKMKVEVVGTTNDPLEDLKAHREIKTTCHDIGVYPSFRPDNAMAADNVPLLKNFIHQLEKITGKPIQNLQEYLQALKMRHKFFADHACKVSDHGLEELYAENYTEKEIQELFVKIMTGTELSPIEIVKFKSSMLYTFALWDSEAGWVQQFHLGALRNNNSRLLKSLGPDTGFDSIGDFSQGKNLSKFLDSLDSSNNLAKTILYNLNPADNEVFAAMAGNFNDGSMPGKMQYGAAWWFLDQKEGITRQLNALSNMGLLSRFIGMLTDSRSFISFTRHEYFRRILCNLLGKEVEKGELPNDMAWIGKIVQDVCYYNAKNYFNFR